MKPLLTGCYGLDDVQTAFEPSEAVRHVREHESKERDTLGQEVGHRSVALDQKDVTEVLLRCEKPDVVIRARHFPLILLMSLR